MLSFSLCPCNLAASLSCWTAEQVIHQKGNIINFPTALQSTYPPLFFFFYLLISTSKLKGVRQSGTLGALRILTTVFHFSTHPAHFFFFIRDCIPLDTELVREGSQLVKEPHEGQDEFLLDLSRSWIQHKHLIGLCSRL